VGQTCRFQFQFLIMVRATGLIFGTETGMGLFLRTGPRIYFYIPSSSFFCKNQIPIQHGTKYPSNTAPNTHPNTHPTQHQIPTHQLKRDQTLGSYLGKYLLKNLDMYQPERLLGWVFVKEPICIIQLFKQPNPLLKAHAHPIQSLQKPKSRQFFELIFFTNLEPVLFCGKFQQNDIYIYNLKGNILSQFSFSLFFVQILAKII